MSVKKQKVAILGGGCGSMTAAYYLSNTPELRAALDITVYQMGWRLGGKGASGRNAAMGQRIEEHGLHVWGGFYYNAFRMMRQCYDALERDPALPLSRWDNAFVKHDFVAWEELIGNEWRTWPLHPPTDDEIPGSGKPQPSMLHSIERIVGWVADVIRDWPHESVRAAAHDPDQPHMQILQRGAVNDAHAEDFDGSPHSAIRSAHQIAGSMAARGGTHSLTEQLTLVTTVRHFRQWLHDIHAGLRELDDLVRRLFVVVDIALTMVSGLLVDGVVFRGWMTIDDYDLKEWLEKHAAAKIAVDSAVVRGYYDYFFAYENGDPGKPRMSAAMGVHHLLRLVADYKGSLFWKMQSGMGDAVFAPLYQLCMRNGVRFEFFHRVDSLEPSSDGETIESIRIARQVTLRNGEYQPLLFPKGVPSWPSAPLLDQIDPAQAAEIVRRKANLEDPWTDWDDAGTIELKAGRDFDAVVLGLSIGAFPSVCREILKQNESWRTMVEKIPAIQTQALQIWWTRPVDALGWTGGNATGTGYANPHQSFSDMSPVIAVEDWPEENQPEAVVYFCGPMPDPAAMPTEKDPAFGRNQTELAWQAALAWSRENLPHLYPRLAADRDLLWELFFDLENRSGEDRFKAQYVRANYTPTERYVLDLPGTNRFRLEADTSGYSNLALAGDWIFTGLGGAVESAVMSGMLAARGLTGRITDTIVDESQSPWRRPRSLRRLLT
jgi:uncharacterized protein with NAD-binding domain and iron-sulfur cluster